MRVDFYKADNFDQALRIFIELAEYYLGRDRSADEVIAYNLRSNILGPESDVKLVLAFNEQGEAIGLATLALLYPAPNETCQLFIKELFVSQSMQRRGVGKYIMRFIAEYAHSRDCSRIDLTVDSDNVGAIDFYRSLGISTLSTKLYLRAETEQIDDLAGHR
ncbi:MAG: GNAT family N-acetyltransferase [Pseudomonadota bacterium]